MCLRIFTLANSDDPTICGQADSNKNETVALPVGGLRGFKRSFEFGLLTH